MNVLRANMLFLMVGILLVFLNVAGAVDTWMQPGMTFDFVDSDVWLRLVRVWELHDHGAWYDRTIARWDAPYGLENHWSRPLDVFLLALAWPASLVMSYQHAMIFAAVACNAVLWIVAIIGMLALCRQLGIRNPGLWVAVFLVLYSIDIAFVLQIGRADHHGLLLALLVWVMALLACHLNWRRRGDLCAAGLVSGLAMWVSPEFILIIAVALVALGIDWVRSGDTARIRAAVLYALMVWAVCAVALFLEWPLSRLLTLSYIRLSIVHVHVLAVTLVAAVLLASMASRMASWRSRLSVAALIGAVSLAWIYYFYPRLHQGPMADTPPELLASFQAVWFELKSMMVIFGVQGTIVKVAAYILPMLAYLHRLRAKYDPAMLFLLVLAASCTALSVYMFRWGSYAAIACLPGWAMLADSFEARLSRRWPSLARQSPRLPVGISVIAVLGLFLSLFAATMVSHQAEEPVSLVDNGKCLREIVEIMEQGELSGPPQVAVTHSDLGGQLLFWTPHGAIAANFNYNEQGLRDLDDFLFAQNEKEAKAIVAKRKIGLVLLCPLAVEKPIFPENPVRSPVFIRQLASGKLPAWLEAVPGKHSKDLLFLRVKSSNQ
jgi:hypothetical protein